MQGDMRGLWRISIVGALAVILIGAGSLSMSWAADKGKKAAQTDQSGKLDRSGTPSVQSTKASGAAIVSKATPCLGTGTPKIVQIDPDEGKAGQKVTITGKSLGAKDCPPAVSFGPGQPAKFEYVNETTLTATVPAVNKKGIRLLTVTTASGGDSKAFLVK
jgi:hypothetical protein